MVGAFKYIAPNVAHRANFFTDFLSSSVCGQIFCLPNKRLLPRVMSPDRLLFDLVCLEIEEFTLSYLPISRVLVAMFVTLLPYTCLLKCLN